MVITEKSEDIANPEWRSFTPEEQNKKTRIGAPVSLARHDGGLATVISNTKRDASGQKLDTFANTTFKRLRTWDFRTQHQSSTDRNLWVAFSHLNTLKDKLILSDVIVEKSAYIYRKAEARGLVRGRTIAAILTAAVYIACREIGLSRTLKDIAINSNIKRKDIARCYRMLMLELDFKVPIADPMKCISKIANKANLTERTTREAMKMMTEIVKREISAGKHPMSIAATVLYMSSIKNGDNITQAGIANAAGVTEVTVRNRIKELNSKLWQDKPLK